MLTKCQISHKLQHNCPITNDNFISLFFVVIHSLNFLSLLWICVWDPEISLQLSIISIINFFITNMPSCQTYYFCISKCLKYKTQKVHFISLTLKAIFLNSRHAGQGERHVCLLKGTLTKVYHLGNLKNYLL